MSVSCTWMSGGGQGRRVLDERGLSCEEGEGEEEGEEVVEEEGEVVEEEEEEEEEEGRTWVS